MPCVCQEVFICTTHLFNCPHRALLGSTGFSFTYIWGKRAEDSTCSSFTSFCFHCMLTLLLHSLFWTLSNKNKSYLRSTDERHMWLQGSLFLRRFKMSVIFIVKGTNYEKYFQLIFLKVIYFWIYVQLVKSTHSYRFYNRFNLFSTVVGTKLNQLHV